MQPKARRVAVIQPLPGIGDMVWHLPHIRAVARWAGQPVTLVAKPRSAADELFSAEKTIGDVLWLDRNPERRRGVHDGVAGFFRFVGALRRQAFDTVVLLHHSRMLAAATCAARIPQRYGYGYGTQRLFLNRAPFLPNHVLAMHPYQQASEWLAAADIPLERHEPSLAVPAERRAAARQRLSDQRKLLIVFGIGSSEPYKQWGARRFADLAEALLANPQAHVLLAGGPAEKSMAQEILQRLGDCAGAAQAVVGWRLGDLAGLLAEADFYVGNDTGVMNLAAAVGIRTYSLFGATPPFHHSSAIVPILPPDGRADTATGMARITTQAVLEVIRRDREGLMSSRDGTAAEPARSESSPHATEFASPASRQR